MIANGVITYAPDSVPNYSLGTTATYSCNTGFSLDLSAGCETRTCVDDGDNDAEGVFNGQAPTCVSESTEYISSSEVQNSLHVEAMKTCIYRRLPSNRPPLLKATIWLKHGMGGYLIMQQMNRRRAHLT